MTTGSSYTKRSAINGEMVHFRCDNDGHTYLVSEHDDVLFDKWVEAMENGDDWAYGTFEHIGMSIEKFYFPANSIEIR